MTHRDAPGWFGKLATQGDFASRRLPSDLVQACDRWLAECVDASRRQLGERWLQSYLGAPVWRFAWGPGLVDPHWWFGVLMPSCDNVGRYFPLLVAQARAQAPGDRVGLDHLDAWWLEIARAATATLAEHATLDAFEQALHQAPPWPTAARSPHATVATASGGRWRQALNDGAGLSELARALAASSIQQRMAGASFWWPVTPTCNGSYTLVGGLPAPESFAEMLTGGW